MPVVNDYTALLFGSTWNGIEVTGKPVFVTFSFPTAIPSYDLTSGGAPAAIQRSRLLISPFCER